MAVELFTFGVKYRLVFSDNEGQEWKLEIEEKDYAGSVTDVIGDKSAFEITWENNDSYSKNIIGSYCRINLMAKPALDSGTPDFSELFTTDENKFRVKVYYNTLNLPLANWALYWQGFIVQDEYVEQISSDPYLVTVVATENFGKLKFRDYKQNLTDNHEDFDTLDEILHSCLLLIGFSADCYDLSGFYLDGAEYSNRLTASGRPFTNQVEAYATSLLKSEKLSDYATYFEALSSFLNSIKCVLIQAFGELYIINRAAYDSVINNNFDWDCYKLTFGSVLFTFSRVTSANVPITLGVDINNQLRVLDRSLIKTRRAANQASINQYKIAPKNLFYNGSFEVNADSNGNVRGWYDGTGTAISYGVKVTDDLSTDKGIRSFFENNQAPSRITNFLSADEATRNSTYTLLYNDTNFDTDSGGNNINPYRRGVPYQQSHSSGSVYQLQGKLEFSLFMPDTVSNMPITVIYSLEWKIPANNRYYDFSNSVWSTSHAYGEEIIEDVGKWSNITKNIPFDVVDGALTEADVVFRLHCVCPADATDIEPYYLDDVSLTITQPEGSEDAITDGDNTFTASTEESTASLGSDVSTVESLTGLTNFYLTAFGSLSLFERIDLLTGKIVSQYFRKQSNEVVDVKWVYDKDPEDPITYDPRTLPLQQWVNEHRWDDTGVTQDLIEGNLINITKSSTGTYVPVTPLDTLEMSFRSNTYDTKHYNIVRMSFNPKLNIINFVGRNIIETEGTYTVP